MNNIESKFLQPQGRVVIVEQNITLIINIFMVLKTALLFLKHYNNF